MKNKLYGCQKALLCILFRQKRNTDFPNLLLKAQEISLHQDHRKPEHNYFLSQEKYNISFFVPFAKAVAQPVSEFGEENLALLGIEKKWEYVPFVILQSVDRNTEGLVSRPFYSYEPTGLSDIDAQNLGIENQQKKEHSAQRIPLNIKKASSMVLPMQFSDFNLINAAACGAKEMPLPVLFKLLPRASRYGFSQEVFAQNLVQRGTFPFIMLIMFVFCACLGWNYRIENPDEIFKFKWTLLIPVLGFIMIVAFNIALYFFNMLGRSSFIPLF